MYTYKCLSIVTLRLMAGLILLLISNIPCEAQVKAALVRNIDEPARVPYFFSAEPAFLTLNVCFLSGSVVPAGKRLRVTRLAGAFFLQDAALTGYTYGLHVSSGGTFPVLIFPGIPFQNSFYGNTVSFNQEIDYYFEAGQRPVLQVISNLGIPFSGTSVSRLTITGYMIDILP